MRGGEEGEPRVVYLIVYSWVEEMYVNVLSRVGMMAV